MNRELIRAGCESYLPQRDLQCVSRNVWYFESLIIPRHSLPFTARSTIQYVSRNLVERSTPTVYTFWKCSPFKFTFAGFGASSTIFIVFKTGIRSGKSFTRWWLPAIIPELPTEHYSASNVCLCSRAQDLVAAHLPYVAHAISHFGVDRVFWSSNFPPDGFSRIRYRMIWSLCITAVVMLEMSESWTVFVW